MSILLLCYNSEFLQFRLGVEYIVTNHSNEVWGLSVDFKENWTEYAMKFNPA